MTREQSFDHFQGKGALEHLKEAHRKGALAAREVHGMELPGYMAACADASKDTILAFLILWTFFLQLGWKEEKILLGFFLFSLPWALWKMGRSALLGWGRLERLHKLIEEEKWEIEHNRAQEKEELKELYQAKGFSGKLLEEVVDVLMADDSRLLKVMLEEELGLKLETVEHPLKQSLGALGGVLFTSSLACLAFFVFPFSGIPLLTCLLVILASFASSRVEHIRPLHPLIWNFSLALFVWGTAFFLGQLFLQRLTS